MPRALLSFTNNNLQWINNTSSVENNTSSVENNTSSKIEDYQGRSAHPTLLLSNQYDDIYMCRTVMGYYDACSCFS